MCHEATFPSESVILSVHFSYGFQFPDLSFEGIFKAFMGTRAKKSEVEWLFCGKRFPTDN